MKGKIIGLILALSILLATIHYHAVTNLYTGNPKSKAEAWSLDGSIDVYVNGRLERSVKMHSFVEAWKYFMMFFFTPTKAMAPVSNIPVFMYYPTYYPGTGDRGATSATTFSPCWYPVSSSVYGDSPSDTPGVEQWSVVVLATWNPSAWALGYEYIAELLVTPDKVLLSEDSNAYYVSFSVSFTATEDKTVQEIWLVRPHGQQLPGVSPNPPATNPFRITQDFFDPPLSLKAGDVATFKYTFVLKPKAFFTKNFHLAFASFLLNIRLFNATLVTTNGSTTVMSPAAPSGGDPPFNAPVDSFIVLGDGSGTPNGVSVLHEVARGEPGVTATESGVSATYTFVFKADTTIREVALYWKMRDNTEVMVVYYQLPQPLTVKAGDKFQISVALQWPGKTGY
jgi:hypothetical protein